MKIFLGFVIGLAVIAMVNGYLPEGYGLKHEYHEEPNVRKLYSDLESRIQIWIQILIRIWNPKTDLASKLSFKILIGI